MTGHEVPVEAGVLDLPPLPPKWSAPLSDVPAAAPTEPAAALEDAADAPTEATTLPETAAEDDELLAGIVLTAWDVGEEYRDDARNAVNALRRAGRIRPADEADERLTSEAAALVLGRWDAWMCLVCGCRYVEPFPEHGTEPCRKRRLQPVTVTVTRRPG